MYALVTNNAFYLSSFDANISYDDVLQSAQAAELQHGSSGQAVGVMNSTHVVKEEKKQINDGLEYKNVKPLKSTETNKNSFKAEIIKYKRNLCNFCGHLTSYKHTGNHNRRVIIMHYISRSQTTTKCLNDHLKIMKTTLIQYLKNVVMNTESRLLS